MVSPGSPPSGVPHPQGWMYCLSFCNSLSPLFLFIQSMCFSVSGVTPICPFCILMRSGYPAFLDVRASLLGAPEVCVSSFKSTLSSPLLMHFFLLLLNGWVACCHISSSWSEFISFFSTFGRKEFLHSALASSLGSYVPLFVSSFSIKTSCSSDFPSQLGYSGSDFSFFFPTVFRFSFFLLFSNMETLYEECKFFSLQSIFQLAPPQSSPHPLFVPYWFYASLPSCLSGPLLVVVVDLFFFIFRLHPSR